ncbi:helix-turn-helix domain-containing protein [Neobacillus vireti]|uniref:helix-turn-helix domain-containing protein n=1 Tax=Neobacillus vireti TaxID=220686 RepID=UPI002FFEB895
METFEKEEFNVLDDRQRIVYDHFLESNISQRNLSLTEIANLTEKSGQRITVSYLSKLKNGKMPPPSYKVSLVLAKILGIIPEMLLAASLSDNDEYKRVELAEALKWAFPEEDEFKLKKRLNDVFKFRFKYIGETEASSLIKNSLLDGEQLRSETSNDPSKNKVPVYTKVTSAGELISSEFVEECIYEDKSNGKLFYFIVSDDSMRTARILKGDKLLINSEVRIKNGDIVLVNIFGKDAIIRKIKKTPSGEVIVYSDNPNFEPIIVNEKEIEIRGKVVKILISL